jgi:glycosyltransferase involved in cell wall biosynthesis
MEEKISYSIVIPAFNEELNLEPLINETIFILKKIGKKFEIIIVDDGSIDNTLGVLKKLTIIYRELVIISFRKNIGQTAAISAGIESAKGEIIITLDADLQNDPGDIPKLIDKLEEGYDVVSGWRLNRKDHYFTSVIPSKIANWIISIIVGLPLHDYGCTLKAYRKEIFNNIQLYGEMHRFIPLYASWQGGKVSELPVNHRPRIHGNSKYGLIKSFSVISDLFFLKFLEKQFSHPIHLFGGFALINLGMSFLSFILMLYFKYFGDKSFIQTPLPQLVILFIMIGILSLLMGFLAEILMRTYFESQDKKVYQIKKIIRGDGK